jgi:hypothetical protein
MLARAGPIPRGRSLRLKDKPRANSTNRGIVNRRQSPDTRSMFRTASTLEALLYWMGEDDDTADFIVSVLRTIEWLAGDGLPIASRGKT